RELHGSAGDERLVAQGDQVLAAHGQRLEDVAAIGLVLLDQQMLRAGGDALLDDRLPVQRALADFGELDDIALPEVEERRGVACLQGVERLGRRHRDAVVLQMHQVQDALEALQGALGIPAAALDPVAVDLVAQVRGLLPQVVQQGRAVERRELHVVVVVAQRDTLRAMRWAYSSTSAQNSSKAPAERIAAKGIIPMRIIEVPSRFACSTWRSKCSVRVRSLLPAGAEVFAEIAAYSMPRSSRAAAMAVTFSSVIGIWETSTTRKPVSFTRERTSVTPCSAMWSL